MFRINPEFELEVLISAAEEAAVAARTAPKANGLDFIVTAIVYGDDLLKLTDEMRRIGEEKELQFILRDASNVSGKVVLIIGSRLKEKAHGFTKDTSNETNIYLDTGIDLGIAIGSAVSVLADKRVDNRVMLSVGEAAVNLKLLGEGVKLAYGIPLSVSGKNPFFDRR